MKNDNFLKKIKPEIIKIGDSALKSFLSFDRSGVILKHKKEIVTKIDKETEVKIIKVIKKEYPDHAFLGEEFGMSKNKSDYLWIIDPIDGTTNFSIKNPLWAISIGLSYKGDIIAGIIYAPFLKDVFWAEKGKGAYLNNKSIKISSPKDNNKLIHTFCHGQRKRDINFAINYYKQQKQKAFDCRQLGSASIELAYVASGRVDSMVIPGIKAWDVAAGALIIREAGGGVYNFKGDNWNLKDKDIIACHPKLKDMVLKTVKRAMR